MEYDTTKKVLVEDVQPSEKIVVDPPFKKLEATIVSTKQMDPKWKEKTTRIVRFATRFIARKTGIEMGNPEIQEISNEWSDVLTEYGVKPPKGVRLIIALIVTIAIVADVYWSVIGKIGKKKQRLDNVSENTETDRRVRPTGNRTETSS